MATASPPTQSAKAAALLGERGGKADGGASWKAADAIRALVESQEAELQRRDELAEEKREEEEEGGEEDELLVKDLDTGRMVPVSALLSSLPDAPTPSPPPKPRSPSFSERAKSLLSWRPSSPSAPPPPQLPRVSCRDLRAGDVVLVRAFNVVSASQALTSWFGQAHTRRGSASAVHAMLVVGCLDACAHVAHLTRTGAYVDYVRNAEEPGCAPVAGGGELQRAMVYRPLGARRRQLARAAATNARKMVYSGLVEFSPWNSVRSAFVDPRYDSSSAEWQYLDALDAAAGHAPKGTGAGGPQQQQEAEQQQPQRISMFCTEFVAKSYQLAIRSMGGSDDPELLGAMDVHAEALTPMALDGYLLSKGDAGVWKCVGEAEYIFC